MKMRIKNWTINFNGNPDWFSLFTEDKKKKLYFIQLGSWRITFNNNPDWWNFFWVPRNIIRRSAATCVANGKIYREFFTFRAFFFFCLWTPFWYLRRDARKIAEALNINPELALRIGAITFDATASAGGDLTFVSPQTYTHTVTGTNVLLVLGYMLRDDNGSGAFPTAITYNSVSFTSVWDQNNSGDTAGEYYLKAPATGAHTVSMSWVAAPTNKGRNAVGTISYTGADQTAPLDVQNSITGSGSTVDRTVTTSNNNEAVVSVCTKDGGTISSVNKTQRWNLLESGLNGAGQDEIVATAGATTHTFNFSTSNVYAVGIAAFKSASAARTPLKTLLGAGL